MPSPCAFRAAAFVHHRRRLLPLGYHPMPYLSRAADRPWSRTACSPATVDTNSGVVWARTDRPAQMLVEVATTESFKDARLLPPITALPDSDFTAKMLIDEFPPGQTFSIARVSRSLANQRHRRACDRQIPHRADKSPRCLVRVGRRCCGTRLGHQSRRWRHDHLRHHEKTQSGFVHSLRRHDLRRRSDPGRSETDRTARSGRTSPFRKRPKSPRRSTNIARRINTISSTTICAPSTPKCRSSCSGTITKSPTTGRVEATPRRLQRTQHSPARGPRRESIP